MIYYRPRRNRKNEIVRSLVRETRLSVDQLIFPLFITEGKSTKTPIASMPGIFRYTPDLMLQEMEECIKLGIKSFALFPQYPESAKDKMASESTNFDGLYLRTINEAKNKFGDNAFIISDVAMDPYSSDGHDGIVENGKILNDETLEVLGNMAIAQARAGVDMVAPSDMMDGRVGHLRNVLDGSGFSDVSIMAYTAKYASAFYGPFRDALDSAPKFGDKKTYQMDPANKQEAISEAELDLSEGADIIMVKPALAYLDVIHLLKQEFNKPTAAYNVSGEYAMIKAAAEKGWLDGEKAMLETLISIKRAGADIILTYFAKEFALLQDRG
jgi:porphobilinogen synthase